MPFAAVEADGNRADLSKAIDGYWISPLTYDTIAQKAADASDVSNHIPQAVLGRSLSSAFYRVSVFASDDHRHTLPLAW